MATSSSLVLAPPEELIWFAEQSSVSINKDGIVVETHQREGIQCCLGKVMNGKVQWWTDEVCCEDSVQWVHYPRVAINNSGTVVVVYFRRRPPARRSDFVEHALNITSLHYLVGQVDKQAKAITWTGRGSYDSGTTPAVALLDDGTVVEVHETENPVLNDLYYHVGVIDSTKASIEWGPSHSYGEGKYPSVAVTNAGVVVEMHKSEVRGKIWYHIGQVSKVDKTISWGHSQYYDNGVDPSVTLSNSGKVLEAHASDGFLRNLWCNTGDVQLHNKTVSWNGKAHKYFSGTAPAIAMNDEGAIIEVHKTSHRLRETVLYTSGFVRS